MQDKSSLHDGIDDDGNSTMKDDGADRNYCDGINDIEVPLKQLRLVATKHKSETCITP